MRLERRVQRLEHQVVSLTDAFEKGASLKDVPDLETEAHTGRHGEIKQVEICWVSVFYISSFFFVLHIGACLLSSVNMTSGLENACFTF